MVALVERAPTKGTLPLEHRCGVYQGFCPQRRVSVGRTLPRIIIVAASAHEQRLLEFARGASKLRDNFKHPYQPPTFWHVSADPFGRFRPTQDRDADAEGKGASGQADADAKEDAEDAGASGQAGSASEEDRYVDAEGEDDEEDIEEDASGQDLSLLFPITEKKPFLIWNRKSYDGLTSNILALLLRGYQRFVVLGTAGIGKSWFAIIWVLKLAIERAVVVTKQGRRFNILDFRKDQPFVSGPHNEFHPLVQEYLGIQSTWLVIDGKQEEPLDYECCILLAVSTQPSNFKEFRKDSSTATLYMPAWRRKEIESFLDDFEPFREEFPWMNVSSREDAISTWKLVGGVPRYVLNSHQSEHGRTELLLAVSKFASNIDLAMQLLAGGYVKDVSDCILHIYTNRTYMKPTYELASEYVRNSLREQLLLANNVRIASFLSATYDKASLGSPWGLCYEAQVNRLLSAGGNFRIKRVYQDGRSDAVTFRRVHSQTLKILENHAALKGAAADGVYLVAKADNFPSVDSLLGFILIQVFKRKSKQHGFKVSGLAKVDKELNRSKYELWSCVPPEIFDETGFQEYVTFDNKPYRRNDKLLNKFEQYVCEVDYRRLTG